MAHSYKVRASDFDAAIFDLDGVITRTAAIHAAAWKEVFDEFLREHAAATGKPFRPFDIERDYLVYVDGKPRYAGVESFLASRGIALPEGSSSGPPSHTSVAGLGNAKNEAFRRRLKEQGVSVYQPAEELVRGLRQKGLKIAVATSSKNGPLVLSSAELEGLFDVSVDGNVAAELGLKGKPNPDIFLEASRRLGVPPERTMLFEDAISGVQAGRRGGYGLIVGLDRQGGREEEMKAAGADIVAQDLAHFELSERLVRHARETGDLPSGLSREENIVRAARDRQIAVFLDYDGTLTPIVDRPELALLPDPMRHTVDRMAGRLPVAVVSGRDLDDVCALVGIDGLVYAGSHGFDVLLPSGERKQLDEAQDSLPLLADAEEHLHDALDKVEGTLIERKRFSVAVHYRLVPETSLAEVKTTVEETVTRLPGLRLTLGKKVLELRPDIDWDKGKALGWILNLIGLDHADVFPVYLGDDLTDEDAFVYLLGWGVGIVVRDPESRPTQADFALDSPREVGTFLERMLAILPEDAARVNRDNPS